MHELLSRRWVPLLLRWLGLVHRPNLQVEALAALTTVAQITTEHTPLLLKVDTPPPPHPQLPSQRRCSC